MDCLEQLHPQPWLNLRWPLADTPRERRRVPCALRDRHGAQRSLVTRLHAKGAMELYCEDYMAMAKEQGRPTRGKARKDEL